MKKFTIFILSIFVFLVSFTPKHYVSPDQVKAKLEVNATHVGNTFKINGIENYYKIYLDTSSATISENVMLLAASNKINIGSSKKAVSLSQIFQYTDAVLMNSDLPAGYYDLVLDFLGICSCTSHINTADNITNNGNTTYNSKKLYSPDIIPNTTTRNIEPKTGYSSAQVYYIADVIYKKIRMEQYHKLWFVDVKLWEDEIEVYVAVNIREEVVYYI